MLTIAIIENGEVLDSVQISREEFASLSQIGFATLVTDLSIGN
jgi:hypothetical protein